MQDRHRDVALFRYSLSREAADASLTKAERGAMVRALSGRDHAGPAGERVQVSRNTIDRWIRWWRAGGFEALVPVPRVSARSTSAGVLDLAVKLKREVPGRTAAQVAEIIATAEGCSPSARTIQRHFAGLGLNIRPDGSIPVAFGRFEAAAPNDRWTGDALHGPVVEGHKAYLFAFVDDHSRAIPGHRWGHSEDTVRLEAALRAGLASRGVPRSVYVDNGSAFVAAPLLRAYAVSASASSTPGRDGPPYPANPTAMLWRRDPVLLEESAWTSTTGAVSGVTDDAWLQRAQSRHSSSLTRTAAGRWGARQPQGSVW